MLVSFLFSSESTLAKPSIHNEIKDITSIDLKWEKSSFHLIGRFEPEASKTVIWNTLQDYEALPNYAPQVVESKVKEVKDGSVFLKQIGKTKFLFFSIHIEFLLKLDIIGNKQILFEDVLSKDFSKMTGSWDLILNKRGKTEVVYNAHATPRGGILFKWITSDDHLKNTALNLLNTIGAEMKRRDLLCEKVKLQRAALERRKNLKNAKKAILIELPQFCI